jgi:hypothetical protein
MSNVKSVQTDNDRKLYQHQMLLSESKFNLQSIDISESDQESDQEPDQESDSDSKLEPKVDQNSIKEMISIQNQIIVENRMNQLCIDIQMTIEQNRRTCQDIDLNNCRVLERVL